MIGENGEFFIAALKALMSMYEEFGPDSIPVSELRALLDHYELN